MKEKLYTRAKTKYGFCSVEEEAFDISPLKKKIYNIKYNIKYNSRHQPS